jgi:hypothetical protein
MIRRLSANVSGSVKWTFHTGCTVPTDCVAKVKLKDKNDLPSDVTEVRLIISCSRVDTPSVWMCFSLHHNLVNHRW